MALNNRNILLYALLFGFLFTLSEISSYVVGHILKKRLVFYNEPSISTYDKYISNRHQRFGWPSKTMLEKKFDRSGSRPIPAFPAPGNACVSLYGDSFTWGDSVEDQHAWSNVLSKQIKCRTANYGVPGFGTDQALLYFEENNSDEAPVVLLNLFTGDIRRHVNQLRNFISDDPVFLLKPRFILQEGKLSFVPLLTPSREEALKLSSNPASVLHHEYFLPGGNSGIAYLHFPFTLSLIKAFANEHVQAKFKGIPIWAEFYREDHPSNALKITFMIMKRFVASARDRGKIPVLAIIPNAHDIEYVRETGKWSYGPLIALLDAEQIEYLDMGPKLLEYLDGRDPCEITEKICYGHYANEGNLAIGSIVAEYLKEKSLIVR